MSIKNKPDFLKVQDKIVRTETEEGGKKRHYSYCQKGKTLKLASVTTIIEGSASQAEAISLATAKKKWDKQHKEGKKQYSWDIYCQQARDRGTNIHEYIEEKIKGSKKQVELPSDFKEAEREIQYKMQMAELIASEFAVVNTKSLIPYAGRADLYIKMYNQKYLIDIKTSNKKKPIEQWEYNKNTKKRVKKIARWYKKAIIQLTAYELGMNQESEYPEALGIWVIHPEGLDQYTINIPKEERSLMWLQRQEIYMERQK